MLILKQSKPYQTVTFGREAVTVVWAKIASARLHPVLMALLPVLVLALLLMLLLMLLLVLLAVVLLIAQG